MAKTKKAERAALDAIGAASAAVTRAEKTAKRLPKKQARLLDDVLDDAREAAYVITEFSGEVLHYRRDL
ncbi:hypothetical protein, partial [Microbacterium dextranolyticum]|uniref:hypothetical protein n=1 Tax=Microbacterium dextranolyticum TaxID=36806 RepID=UPI003CD054D0